MQNLSWNSKIGPTSLGMEKIMFESMFTEISGGHYVIIFQQDSFGNAMGASPI